MRLMDTSAENTPMEELGRCTPPLTAASSLCASPPPNRTSKISSLWSFFTPLSFLQYGSHDHTLVELTRSPSFSPASAAVPQSTAKWRSLWTVGADGTVSGLMKAQSHYFENGNVQLNAKEESSTNLPELVGPI